MRYFLLLILMASFFFAGAQEILSVDDAINIALKNNFDILVARNDADITRANNTAGNAGMLPIVELNGSGNYELNNVTQKLSSGTENKYPSLSSTSINAGSELSWTLFDGGKMFVTKNKLNEIEALGEIQFKDQVLQIMFDVIAAYYNVVKQKQQLESINEAINYNSERLKIAQTGFDAGLLAKTDLLQAKIDLNVTKENIINQKYFIEEAKKNLQLLLGQSATTDFEVSDSIPHNYSPNKEELLQKLNSSNPGILSFQKQIDIARLSLKEYNKDYAPNINLHAGYYYSHGNNTDGSVLNNRSFGPQVGGSLTIPLYSAGENKRKIDIAKIQLKSSEFQLQDISLKARTELLNAFSDFENQLQLMQIEKENKELTQENLEINIQRLRLGQATSLEVHQAQENYVQSCTRLVNFEYQLKLAETRLKQLVANL